MQQGGWPQQPAWSQPNAQPVAGQPYAAPPFGAQGAAANPYPAQQAWPPATGAAPGYHGQPMAAAQGQQVYSQPDDPNAMASEVSVAARAKFIERTYLHLALAIAVFVVLSGAAQMVPGVEALVGKMIGHRYSWGVVLALFMGAGYVADKWAAGDGGKGMQYAGLMLYTLAEVVIFIPMIFLVKAYVGIEPILAAGAATLAAFAGLTAYVLITKKDFSFMKGTLTTIAMASLGLIVASIVWGFSLGMVFSVAMIVLGAGYILYYTSRVQQHYRTDQYVAAALALFSALAFVFWYVLRIILSMARN